MQKSHFTEAAPVEARTTIDELHLRVWQYFEKMWQKLFASQQPNISCDFMGLLRERKRYFSVIKVVVMLGIGIFSSSSTTANHMHNCTYKVVFLLLHKGHF